MFVCLFKISNDLLANLYTENFFGKCKYFMIVDLSDSSKKNKKSRHEKREHIKFIFLVQILQ